MGRGIKDWWRERRKKLPGTPEWSTGSLNHTTRPMDITVQFQADDTPLGALQGCHCVSLTFTW